MVEALFFRNVGNFPQDHTVSQVEDFSVKLVKQPCFIFRPTQQPRGFLGRCSVFYNVCNDREDFVCACMRAESGQLNIG